MVHVGDALHFGAQQEYACPRARPIAVSVLVDVEEELRQLTQSSLLSCLRAATRSTIDSRPRHAPSKFHGMNG